MTNKQAAEFFKKTFLFGGLPPSKMKMLVKYANENVYGKEELIFNEGDKGDSLHIIVSGLVRIVKYSRQGKTKTLALLNSRDSFGEMALLTKEARSATVEAVEKTKTLSVTKGDFAYIIQKEPSISLQIIRTLSERLARADRDIRNLALGDARSKIACVLTDFKKDIEIHKFTHQEIAELAGLTRETTTRIIRLMEKEGIISSKQRKIIIVNHNRLRELCV